MSITYPLTMPTLPGFKAAELNAATIVGMSSSMFTGEQQVYAWPGQLLAWALTLPPMHEDVAAVWAAFFMSMNGPEGTCYFTPPSRTTPRGSISGSVTVGAGAVANATTLPLSGGSGTFAVGDWLQVGATTAARLHRVLKVNAGSVDVFPRLRSAYANGTAIVYNNSVGLFRLAGIPPEAYDDEIICNGIDFTLVESL